MDTYTFTTWVTIDDALELCAAITVPCATPAVPVIPVVPIAAAAAAVIAPTVPTPAVPAPTSIPAKPAKPAKLAKPAKPATPTTLPRRSQRLLAKLRPPTTTPAVLAPKKDSSRSRKRSCKLCKGKQKAAPAPIRIRLGITSKAQFRDFDMVKRVHMGFRHLGQDEKDKGKITLLLTLGANIKSEELVGLDRIEVDIRLGFAKK